MPKVTTVASVEVLAKGAVTEVSLDGGTTYVELLGLDKVPRIGSEGSFVRMDNVDEIVKRFQKGTRTPPEYEIPCKRIGNNVLQDGIIAKAQDDADETPISMRVTYRTGDIATVDVILNGIYFDEVPNDDAAQMFAVKGQQTGDVVFTKVA